MIGDNTRRTIADPSFLDVLNRAGINNTPMGSPLDPGLSAYRTSGFGNEIAEREQAGRSPVFPLPIERKTMMGGRVGPPPMATANGVPQTNPGSIGGASSLPSGRFGDFSLPDMALPAAGIGAISSPKPGFFQQGGLGQQIAGVLGPALMAAGGNTGGAINFIQGQQQLRAQRQRQLEESAFNREKFAWEREKDMRPDFRSVGRSVLSIPFEGAPSVLYSDPTEAERYASGLGYEPGTEEYRTALDDYVLRGNGPTAFGFDRELEGVRQGNRESLEGVRQRNRLSLRGTPTYRDLNPTPRGGGPSSGGGRAPRSINEAVAPIFAKLARGETLSAGENSALAAYSQRTGRGGSSPASPSRPSGGGYTVGQTATGPGGKRVRWNGSRWEPAR